MVKNVTCTVCPMGCAIEVTINGDEMSVKGNTCKRGEVYARAEVTCPTRVLTSTMKCEDGAIVSVKSRSALPKEKMFECMSVINSTAIKGNVKIGDTLIENILGTGVDIIATSNEVRI